jgi:hypothetical protein
MINKILVKCLDCNYEKEIIINNLVKKGLACTRCGDGVSYPQKFMFNVLEQLIIIFKTELSKTIFKWCNNFRYDFYIDKISCVVETHGLQHYEDSKSGHWGGLDKIQKNDKAKEQLAQENNIANYIVLDCRYSTLEWIKNSIMTSRLPKLLNFKESDIDWLKCHEYACSSRVKIVSDLWNNGVNNITKIAQILKMRNNAIRKYLKQGLEIGWCDYDPKEEEIKNRIKNRTKNGKQTICLTTNEIFKSITEASKKYGISEQIISNCCLGKQKIAGHHPLTNKEMVWMFYKDFIIKSKKNIKDILNNVNYNNHANHVKKVICLTTAEIFDSIVKASKKYNFDKSGISKCCRKIQKSAGKHPITGEKLEWMYYDEYLKINQFL